MTVIASGAAGYVQYGVAGTTANLLTTRRKYDLSDRVIMQYAAYYPFLRLMIETPAKRQTKDYHFKILTQSSYPTLFTPVLTSAGTGTTENIIYLSVEEARMVAVNDLLTVSGLYTNDAGAEGAKVYSTTQVAGYSPEVIMVVSKGAEDAGNDRTPITVRREHITSATAIGTSMKLKWSGNAQEHGYTVALGFVKNMSDEYNYTQQFSEPYAVDEVADGMDMYGPNLLSTQQEQHRARFMEGLNNSLMFGKRRMGATASGQAKPETGGLMEYIPSANQRYLNAPLTLEMLNDYAVEWAAKGSKTKYVFTGPTAAAYLSNKLLQYFTINDKMTSSLGTPPIYEYDTPSGLKLRFFLNGTAYGTDWANDMAIVDMAQLKYVVFDGKDIRHKSGLQTKRETIIQNEWAAHVGLERTYSEAHHKLCKITG